MSHLTTGWCHAVRNRMSQVAKHWSHVVWNQMSHVTTGWGHVVRNSMSQVATGWSHAVWNRMTTPYKDYIQTFSFLQTYVTYVTQCLNKVVFQLCSLLSFIFMLELQPYNLLPPCNNVTTSNHIITPSLILQRIASRGLVTSCLPKPVDGRQACNPYITFTLSSLIQLRTTWRHPDKIPIPSRNTVPPLYSLAPSSSTRRPGAFDPFFCFGANCTLFSILGPITPLFSILRSGAFAPFALYSAFEFS